MMRTLIGVLILAAAAAGQPGRVDRKAEEAALRKEIETVAPSMPRAKESYLWTGAYPRPRIGSDEPAPYAGAGVGQRKNQKTTNKVEFLALSEAGDFAYAWQKGRLEFDLDAAHLDLSNYGLVVYKKVDGKWMTVAHYLRPVVENYVEPEKALAIPAHWDVLKKPAGMKEADSAFWDELEKASGAAGTTDNAIVWVGTSKSPSRGGEGGESYPNFKAGARKNLTRANRLAKVEVAASGDYAYSLTHYLTTYDFGPGTAREGHTGSTLQVWKKEKGKWLIALQFARSHNQKPPEETSR